MSERYQKSEQWLERALRTIPVGSQTFSKSKTQFPPGVSPYFIKKGLGSHVWDVDGNEYIDFINGLGCITLGYGDPDVKSAVQTQLEAGTIFSLPHPLEVEVAEKLVDVIPCAEMVRFGKNGSDATAAAIRLARAYTRRDHVAVCGYHGWQDWYIGSTTRNLGVPEATQKLTHKFSYNNIDSLAAIFKDRPDGVAAVIMEAMNVTPPATGFLESVRDLSHRHGAVFIFDEVVTGFRFANGGAQEYFGVTPDLAAFGKGIANGFPLSLVTGKAGIMRLMEDIFFSTTFGGETLSLAAAQAVLEKYQRLPVIETLIRQGKKVLEGVQRLLVEKDLSPAISISGHPSWTFLQFKDCRGYSQWEIKTLFLQEMFKRGILTFATHNMSFSHSDEDIAKLLNTETEVFQIIHEALDGKDLEKRLHCKPLEPLFKVR